MNAGSRLDTIETSGGKEAAFRATTPILTDKSTVIIGYCDYLVTPINSLTSCHKAIRLQY